MGFPFDRPYLVFYQRLEIMHSTCTKILSPFIEHPLYQQLFCSLQKVMDDTSLRNTASQMQQKVLVFDKLRRVMRIALPDKKQGLNDDGEETDIRTIEKGVKDFRDWLCSDYTLSSDLDFQKMIAQIDKYWEKLFADPLPVVTLDGVVYIQPQRTNNILEH